MEAKKFHRICCSRPAGPAVSLPNGRTSEQKDPGVNVGTPFIGPATNAQSYLARPRSCKAVRRNAKKSRTLGGRISQLTNFCRRPIIESQLVGVLSTVLFQGSDAEAGTSITGLVGKVLLQNTTDRFEKRNTSAV